MKDRKRTEISMLVLRLIYDEMYPIEPSVLSGEYIGGRNDRAIDRYNHDPILHAKVQTATARIIDIIG